MNISIDRESDTAYIDLGSRPGTVDHTVEALTFEGRGQVLVDIDAHGKICGFEIIGAEALLALDAT